MAKTVGSGQMLSTIYKWKIRNYPSYSNLTNGKCINSPFFEIKKMSWYLAMYPNGFNEKSNKTICVFLRKATIDLSVKVKFAMSIFDNDKNKLADYCPSEYLSFDEYSHGFCSEIKSCSITDSVTILCEIITDDVEIDQTLLMNDSVKVKIFDAFQSYLNNARFSDVKFVIGKETILAHKMVLAANSTVFDAMFNHEMQENRDGSVVIKDIKFEVFSELLRFMYTGETNLSENMAIELLIASDKYEILELKQICEVELCKNFSTTNVIECLRLAGKYTAQSLRKEAIDFIVSHGQEMIDQPDFDSLRNLDAELFKDIFRSFVAQPNKKSKMS